MSSGRRSTVRLAEARRSSVVAPRSPERRAQRRWVRRHVPGTWMGWACTIRKDVFGFDRTGVRSSDDRRVLAPT